LKNRIHISTSNLIHYWIHLNIFPSTTNLSNYTSWT